MKVITIGGVNTENYYITMKNGLAQIFSCKRGNIKPMSMPTSGKRMYPGTEFQVKGKSIGADLHRVIAENYLPFPRPSNFSAKVWKETPVEVKNYIKSLMFVNHIDHNKYNWHLDNLEWATAKENVRATHKHYGTNRG